MNRPFGFWNLGLVDLGIRIWNLDLEDLGLPDSGMWNYWVTELGSGMIGIEENDEKKVWERGNIRGRYTHYINEKSDADFAEILNKGSGSMPML